METLLRKQPKGAKPIDIHRLRCDTYHSYQGNLATKLVVLDIYIERQEEVKISLEIIYPIVILLD